MNLSKEKSSDLINIYNKIEEFLKFLEKEEKDSIALSENIGKK